jgi:hypothetical protein
VREVESAAADDWDDLAALDEAITGTDRRRLLQALFADQPAAVRCVREGGRPCGYLCWRPGRQAFQVGPCIGTPAAAALLFADACHHLAGHPVFVDVPLGNEAAGQLSKSLGLKVQRYLMRMGRGVPCCERLESLWASTGPEKG